MQFTVPVTLPSGKIVRLPELKNKHFFTILKYCTNEDIEGLSLYFKWLLFEYYKLPANLTYLDIIYLLITMRMIFVDSKIYIANDDGKEISIDLKTVLSQIEALETTHTITYKINDISVEVGLPSEIYFANFDELFLSTIKTVSINSNKIVFSELSTAEKNVVIENLPGTLFTKVKDFVQNLNTRLGTIPIIENNEVFKLKEITVDVFSNQLLLFVKSIYTQNLKTFFEVMYHYINKVSQDFTTYMELSPVDSAIVFNFFKQEIKEKNEELKKQNTK